LEGSGCSLIEALAWHLPGGIEKKHEKPQDSGFLAEIRTEHLPITECYRYALCSALGELQLLLTINKTLVACYFTK
jgi:hypothetical protein